MDVTMSRVKYSDKLSILSLKDAFVTPCIDVSMDFAVYYTTVVI